MQSINKVQELKEYIFNKELYLFGAGKVAHVLTKWIFKEGGTVKGIVVSDKKNNPDEILGIKVLSINELSITEESWVLIALLEKNQCNVECNLQSVFKSNILNVTDELYLEVKRQTADYEVEIFQAIKAIKNDVSLLKRDNRSNQVYYHKYFWENNYEKKIVELNWGKYYLNEDFTEKFLGLIKGLDVESIDIVSRIVNRHRRYLEKDDLPLDLFTEKEKEELKKQKDDFWNLIVKVSDNLFMYRGYFLTENVFEPSVFYYKHGVSKIRNREKLKGGVFFDVGGYVGDSVLVLNELEPSVIYTFEAFPEHCEKIKENLTINGITNARVECMALLDQNKVVSFDVSGSSSNAIQRAGVDVVNKIEVNAKTLDDYVTENDIDDIRLIKVDIEGSEPYFLEGARDTISKYRPTLLLSIYHNAHDFFEIKPMIESWNLGYSFRIFKSINGNVTNEVLLIAEVM